MKVFLGAIGVVLLALGNVGAIGYGLYLWGGTGMAIGLAAWTAFKVWLAVVGTGFVLFLGSMFSVANEKHSNTPFNRSNWKNL